MAGVCFLLSQKALDNLLEITSISARIIKLELEGNPKTTVICVYCPHNASPESDVEEFYTTLRSIVERVPLHNFLVIAGDLNAKLGPDSVRFTYNKETNSNGELLIDFMKEYNLFSSNTSFMKPKGQLWTFEYPNGGRVQLDYLIFRKKWRNTVKDLSYKQDDKNAKGVFSLVKQVWSTAPIFLCSVFEKAINRLEA